MPQIKEIALTKNRNKIELFAQNLEDFERTVLFLGVTHGDEPQGKYLIERYLDLLTQRNTKPRNSMLFIPCVNPDGLALKTRTNANGVDINRNFPTKNWEKTDKNEFFGGDAPNSEIETQFLVYVIEKYKPDVIISFHAPYCVVNYDGDAREIALEISNITEYPVKESIGYPTPGSFGTFAGIEKQIPTITLELDETLPDIELWRKVKGIFEFFE